MAVWVCEWMGLCMCVWVWVCVSGWWGGGAVVLWTEGSCGRFARSLFFVVASAARVGEAVLVGLEWGRGV